MNKIEVLHILNSVGGVDVSLRLILENIDPENFESIVIHGSEDTKRKFYNKDEKLIKEYKLPIQREIHLIKDLVAVYKTIVIIRKERPDIIHAHSAKGGIIARIASLFVKINVFHTPQAYSYLSSESAIKRKLFLLIEKLFKNFNSILLASSESERQRGINEVGYNENKALLFNNSILPIKINEKLREVQNIELPSEFICTVGRPSYQKNIEMMIEVIRHLHQQGVHVNLIIMGVGEYSPNIENVKKLIVKYRLEQFVTLIKWMDRSEIFKIVKKAKLYISTARYEGLPYSIIESLSLAKACIVTNCDGNRDLVKNNENGFVIDEGDVEKMADSIKILYNDDALRTKFEKKSLAFFEENFNMKNNISKLEAFYRDYSK